MTENNEQAGAFRSRVAEIISAGYEEMYVKLATHHDDDVIKALQEMGETEVLEGYAEWAEITLPGALDPEETTDGVVPDPHDAPSYNNYPEPKRRVEEFTAGELLDKVVGELPFSYVIQTGGGTASIVFRKSPEDNPILAGPGAYHWNVPRLSIFNAGDFYYGPDTIGIDTDEPKHEGPGETMDPAWTLDQLAEKIKAAYAAYNTEGASK